VKFNPIVLRELAWEGESDLDKQALRKVKEWIHGMSRWSSEHTMIFTDGTKYWTAYFRNGATESQDESPYQYEIETGKEVECKEVRPVRVEITAYKDVT